MIRLATLALFVALAASAPTSNVSSEEKLVIDGTFFADKLKIYTAEHDIISVLYPLNTLNFDDDDEIENKIIFFVEADVANGIEYKGLSVFKDGNVTKILPTGTCAAADLNDKKTTFFGATDGLYQYNATQNTAVKYGPITDSIIDIAKANGTDLIYILTDKNELFKVTEDGTKKEKVASVVGAKQIVLDYSNNLYYYAADKKPHVVTAEGITEFKGLPSNPDYIKLIRPAFVIEDGVPIVVDKMTYIIYANGSVELSDFVFEVKPSAYAIEATLSQYYAYNKSIYEYNVVSLLVTEVVQSLQTFFESKQDEILELATRSRTDFSA